jgi:hypothetical protein
LTESNKKKSFVLLLDAERPRPNPLEPFAASRRRRADTDSAGRIDAQSLYVVCPYDKRLLISGAKEIDIRVCVAFETIERDRKAAMESLWVGY